MAASSGSSGPAPLWATRMTGTREAPSPKVRRAAATYRTANGGRASSVTSGATTE
ncbi:MAG: hypothetical protein ACTHMW_09230 [Actinomycetes bacterium]